MFFGSLIVLADNSDICDKKDAWVRDAFIVNMLVEPQEALKLATISEIRLGRQTKMSSSTTQSQSGH